MATEKESPAEDYTETDESDDTGTMPEKSTGSGAVKIPEDFQKQVTSLIDSCDDKACLDFIMSECSKKQTEMAKSEDKGFSDEAMPAWYYMKKNTKVSWQILCAMGRGNGVTISDEDTDGTVLVAVENLSSPSAPGAQHLGYHPVIHCTVTWLTTDEPQ